MTSFDISTRGAPAQDTGVPTDRKIPQLVAEVFESAPLDLRSRLIEHLLRPLGVLSLVAIADGIFANIRFRGGWPDVHVQTEDMRNLQGHQVVALVERVQQLSVDSINGLARMLADAPVLAGSTATAMLLTLLLQQSRNRRNSDTQAGGRSGVQF
jgi:hypothetical protein